MSPAARPQPIAFAHRGARAHAPENTLAAFTLAQKLGATGLESDVWLTRDGIPVLDHDGVVGSWWRRRPIATVSRDDLPEHIPTLAEFYATAGSAHHVSLDVKDSAAIHAVIAVATEAGAAAKLWLCHPDAATLATWRDLSSDVRLVDSTRLAKITEGTEKRARRLREDGIDAVNLHWSDWTAGHVATFHRFGLRCFGWDAQFPHALNRLLDAKIDGLYSDHVDRMMDAIRARVRSEEPEVG